MQGLMCKLQTKTIFLFEKFMQILSRGKHLLGGHNKQKKESKEPPTLIS